MTEGLSIANYPLLNWSLNKLFHFIILDVTYHLAQQFTVFTFLTSLFWFSINDG